MFKDTNATDTYRLLLCTRVSAKAAAVNHLADTERPSKPYSLNLTLNPHFFTNNVSSKINVQRAMFNDVINFLNFERQ